MRWLGALAFHAGNLAVLDRGLVGRAPIGEHLGGLSNRHAGPAQHFGGLLDLGAELGLTLGRTGLDGLLALGDGIVFRLDALADVLHASIGLLLHSQRAFILGAMPEVQRAALIL